MGAFDDLNGPAPDGFQGVAQLWPGLAAIGKNRAQHGKPHGHGFQHIRRTVPVPEPGTVPHPSDQQAKRVGDDRALATLDPLAHVIAGNPAPFPGFHALAVEDTGGRAGLATLGQTRHPDKRAGQRYLGFRKSCRLNKYYVQKSKVYLSPTENDVVTVNQHPGPLMRRLEAVNTVPAYADLPGFLSTSFGNAHAEPFGSMKN